MAAKSNIHPAATVTNIKSFIPVTLEMESEQALYSSKTAGTALLTGTQRQAPHTDSEQQRNGPLAFNRGRGQSSMARYEFNRNTYDTRGDFNRGFRGGDFFRGGGFRPRGRGRFQNGRGGGQRSMNTYQYSQPWPNTHYSWAGPTSQHWPNPPCPYPNFPQQSGNNYLGGGASSPGLLGPRPVQPSQAHHAYAPTNIEQAMYTMSLQQPDPNFYMDTGATTNMTHERGLQDPGPYSPVQQQR